VSHAIKIDLAMLACRHGSENAAPCRRCHPRRAYYLGVHRKFPCNVTGWAAPGNLGTAKKLTGMKMTKAIRQQAATAERVAMTTADTAVAGQMRALAQAFRVQAEIIKKNKKKKKK
jgi:hypothetical protein